MIKRRPLLYIALFLIVLIVAISTLGLWNAKGNWIDLIRGQLPAEPRQLKTTASQDGGQGQPYLVTVQVDLSAAVGEVAPEFLSFSIDASQVTGGKWWDPAAKGQELGTGSVHAPLFDFNRVQLDTLVAGLAPAYLRVGGSESDKVFYDMQPADSSPRPPANGYQSVLTREEWDALNAFAQRLGLKVVFTLNDGPANRDSAGQWNGANAADLLAYTAQKEYPVSVWELGNEVNNFWFVFGPKNQITTAQYAQDLLKVRQLVNQITPTARLGGQGSMFWPVLGEPLNFFYGFMPAYLQQSGAVVDIVSWHYYPQQSRRGPVATRRASPARLLDPANLDEAGYWADKLRVWRDSNAPGKPLWLGETGNAQFGGEPGLSDVYLADLWWLDELGLMARKGMQVVVRQTISGSNYGLIDDVTLAPRPDYWASLLWKRLMGPQVYAASAVGAGANRLRVYAQAAPDGQLGMVLINLDPEQNAAVSLPWLKGKAYTLYSVTAQDIFGQEVALNGRPLRLAPSGELPEIVGASQPPSDQPRVTLHPLSYTFITVKIK
jgi:heparanase